MLFEIERDALVEGLSKTVPITEKRSPLPILSQILMDSNNAELVLTATDLEVGLQMRYNCDVKEAGSVTVPAKKIYEIVRELPSGPLSVHLIEGSRVKIVSGRSEFHLAGMDPSDYPAWPAFDDIETAPIQAATLTHMIDKTIFASSSDDSRFNLNGVLFEQAEDTTRLVATDGHRLAMINQKIAVPFTSKVLVPKKGLQELRRLLENLKDEISMGFEKKNLFVKTDQFMMTVRLIDGDYPDYRKVIPEAGDRVVKANRVNMTQSLRKVAVLTSERNRGINVQVNPGSLEVTATHPDLGTARDIIEVDYQGEGFEVIVNVTYLMESLAAVDTDIVSIEYHKEGAPIVIRPDPAKEYFNLVMPMRK
ncbi:MAG: DNA polymerase III subunit beta [Desulfomonile tiedjei]|nr:DNA polymerase III subunit beta [Desulfomonile tiedjei]